MIFAPFFSNFGDMARMFKSLQKSVNTIVRNLNKVAKNAINENLSVMADMNREQLTFGYNTEGGAVGLYRSEAYARLKKSIGSRSPFGTVDLKLTGDFHSGIFASRRGDDLIFGSTDGKTADLVSRYGPILGLTKESQTDVTDNYIFPIITDWIGQQIRQI